MKKLNKVYVFFTPISNRKESDATLLKTYDEFDRSRGLGYKGTIKDKITGKTYDLYGASCGLSGCQCAVIAKKVK